MDAEGRVGPAARRSGAETRKQAQQVALDLFTAHGYEGTSLRQIAEALGINKASLYYHFPSKEAILRSLFEDRGSEAQELVEWVRRQPRTPELFRAAVERWVDSFSMEKLRGIRFLRANPLVAGARSARDGDRIGTALGELTDELAALLPSRTPEQVLLLRMSILSINAAVEAAVDTEFADEDIVRAAHTAAEALIGAIVPPGG